MSSSRQLMARVIDNQVVLAEKTKTASLEWEMHSEERLSAVLPAKTLPVGRRDDLLFGIKYRLRREYPSLDGSLPEHPVLIEHSGVQFDSPASNWIALNPILGNVLGWKVASSGLFRWIDTNDETMVETVWWTEGGFHSQPPHHRDQVAEGWLVLASRSALEAITRHTGPFRRVMRIVRSNKQNIAEARVDAFSELI